MQARPTASRAAARATKALLPSCIVLTPRSTRASAALKSAGCCCTAALKLRAPPPPA